MKELTYFEKLRSEKSIFLTLIFTILLFLIEEAIFDGVQIFSLLRALPIPTIPNGGIFEAVSLISASFTIATFFIAIIIFRLSFTSSAPFKVFYFILFSIASLAQFGYWKAIHRHMNVYDFYVGATTSSDVWLFSLQKFFSPLAFLPISLYACFLLFIQPKSPSHHKSFLLISGLILFLGIGSHLFEEPDFATFSVTKFYKSAVQVAMVESDESSNQRIQLPDTHSPKPKYNLIYIIDESIRDDHLSLYNYERDTTPMLKSLQKEGMLIHWEDTIASSSCSIASNSILMSGIKKIPDTERLIYQNPTIFQYAKAMGFTTHYYNIAYNQLWNGLQSDDLLYIDSYVKNKTLGNPDKKTADILVAKQLAEITKVEVGHFFVINKVGIHFPYEANFPEEETIWTNSPPHVPNESVIDLINNYDNGIRYNNESFFQTLLSNPNILENTTIIYTSDHGQNLGEIEGHWSHCGNSRYEVEVPLFLLGANLPDNLETNYKAHHTNIFPTILDLMQVPSEIRVTDYALSLLEATEKDSTKRYFMPGGENIFTGQPVPYNDELD